jgi:hypothetical protein
MEIGIAFDGQIDCAIVSAKTLVVHLQSWHQTRSPSRRVLAYHVQYGVDITDIDHNLSQIRIQILLLCGNLATPLIHVGKNCRGSVSKGEPHTR